MMIYILFQI